MSGDLDLDALNAGVGNDPARRSIDIHVGARLSRRREELGFCQKRLGQKMKLNEATIRSFEGGYTRIESNDLFRFSQILNTTISFFYAD